MLLPVVLAAALMNAAMVAASAVSTILPADELGSSLAGVPNTAGVLGTAAGAIAVGRWTTRLGRAHALAGPEILSRTDLLAHLADALDREITFRTSTREETITALRPTMGDNATWYVDNVLIDFAPTPESLPITSVEDITGKPATTFSQWAHANADRFLAD